MAYGYGGVYGGMAGGYGLGMGAPMPGFPSAAYGAQYAQAPATYGPDGEIIRTIFITGFPEDVKEREVNNMCRFVPGYLASQMTWKNGMAQGFALFESAQVAMTACSLIAGVQFDEQSTLRCEMARKNMFTKDDPMGAGAPGIKRPRFAGGFGQNNTFSIISAGDGVAVQPIQPTGFAPVTNVGDNAPCSTLFVGNLGDAISENELRGLFAVQPGFRQCKLVRSARSTTAFVEFDEVAQAMAVHASLQGAILPSSDRGGIRIQYSKNPFGKRKDGMMMMEGVVAPPQF